MKLRLGDLLIDPNDTIGVILHLPEVERNPIIVHWFADDVSYAYPRSFVEQWRKKALDRRTDFL